MNSRLESLEGPPVYGGIPHMTLKAAMFVPFRPARARLGFGSELTLDGERDLNP